MTGDRWTLLLLRGERRPIRQFSVSQRAVHYCAGALAVVVLGLTGVGVGLGLDSAAHVKARLLARQNAALTAELGAIQGRVNSLEGKLGELAQLDQRARLMAGLDSLDAEVLQVVASLVKQRRDSIEQFASAGRTDLVEKETGEIAVLEHYLPPAIDPGELENLVAAAIAETGATSPKDMGKVMKAVMPKLAGRNADGKTVNEIVRRKLGGA